MKKLLKQFITACLLILLVNSAFGQVKALTEFGDSVMLLNDGSWQFLENYRKLLSEKPIKIDTNALAFFKPAKAMTESKDTSANYAIWYNSKVWEPANPKELNADATMAFQLKEGEGYGIIIYEDLNIPLKTLKEIALANAQKVGAEVDVTKEEYRMVNDVMILCMRTNTKISGFDLSYIYYFGNTPSGTIQFISFTAEEQMPQLEKEVFNLMNGLLMTKN